MTVFLIATAAVLVRSDATAAAANGVLLTCPGAADGRVGAPRAISSAAAGYLRGASSLLAPGQLHHLVVHYDHDLLAALEQAARIAVISAAPPPPHQTALAVLIKRFAACANALLLPHIR